MGVEMQKRVKTTELDMKMVPLVEERDKIQLHKQMLEENLIMVSEVLSQNQNEKQMIEEDLAVSESMKANLVF